MAYKKDSFAYFQEFASTKTQQQQQPCLLWEKYSVNKMPKDEWDGDHLKATNVVQNPGYLPAAVEIHRHYKCRYYKDR